MLDRNKEIKVSDLFKRPKKPLKPPARSRAASRRSRSRAAGAGRAEARRVAYRSLPCRQRGSATSSSSLHGPHCPGNRGCRRGARRGGPWCALDRFFGENKLPRRDVRLGIGTTRVGVRTLDSRVSRTSPARQCRSVPRARSPLDPDRSSRARLPLIGETVDDAGRSHGGSFSPPHTASRSTTTSRPAASRSYS